MTNYFKDYSDEEVAALIYSLERFNNEDRQFKQELIDAYSTLFNHAHMEYQRRKLTYKQFVRKS